MQNREEGEVGEGGGGGEEVQYLNLVRRIIETGVHKKDRTGTGTLSIFGAQQRFSLRNNAFPLLTTKRVFWRGVAEELFWFLSGSTDATVLSQKRNVHIWDANGSRENLDKMGFHDREVGDLGPIYGFQWRHFGGKYYEAKLTYDFGHWDGIDQVNQCIDLIKNDPDSRRIILCAWNPVDIPKMVLPPCHVLCQFYVANGELSCHMYQRSADMGLGVPFNIASYALLTILMAHVCKLKPGEFIHSIGDAHVYVNHIEQLKLQIERIPLIREFPKLFIVCDRDKIDQFQFSDLRLDGYNPCEPIKMEMAV